MQLFEEVVQVAQFDRRIVKTCLCFATNRMQTLKGVTYCAFDLFPKFGYVLSLNRHMLP
jgi:hypothetical protein